MLWALPFIVMGMLFAGNYLPLDNGDGIFDKGFVDMVLFSRWERGGLVIASSVAVLGAAYLIFFISEKFRLLQQTTVLPSLLFVLLVSPGKKEVGVIGLLVAVCIVTLAVERLQASIRELRKNAVLFNFGALVVLAVLLHPKLVGLILWALCVPLFSGRSTLKDMMALLFGMLTPIVFLVFLVFFYFGTDSLASLPVVFADRLLGADCLHRLSPIGGVRWGILAVVFFMALFNFSSRYPALTVRQRRGMLAMLSMLFFLVLALFVVPGGWYYFSYIVALPLSFLYAQFFLTQRSAWFGNLTFVLLLVTCLLAYLE